MKKRVAIALIGMMCVMTLASGCGSKKEEAEAEATEAATEISITADVVEEPTEPVVAEEPEVEPYDFSAQETVSEPEVPETVADVDEYGVSSIPEVKLYATEAVRIRRQPNTDAEIAGKLAAGDEVTANGKSEEWHRIIRNGETLYVKSEYLTETKPEKTEENEGTDTAEADTTTTETETAATDTSSTDAAAALAAAAASQTSTTTTDTSATAATDTSSSSASTSDTSATDAAAAQAAAVSATAGLPSWVVGSHGVDAKGAADAYNYLKNTKGLDDGTIQANWDSLMYHYSGHGTAGW